jgi:hypothetical protein
MDALESDFKILSYWKVILKYFLTGEQSKLMQLDSLSAL